LSAGPIQEVRFTASPDSDEVFCLFGLFSSLLLRTGKNLSAFFTEVSDIFHNSAILRFYDPSAIVLHADKKKEEEPSSQRSVLPPYTHHALLLQTLYGYFADILKKVRFIQC
jgi:hypothetical protein